LPSLAPPPGAQKQTHIAIVVSESIATVAISWIKPQAEGALKPGERARLRCRAARQRSKIEN